MVKLLNNVNIPLGTIFLLIYIICYNTVHVVCALTRPRKAQLRDPLRQVCTRYEWNVLNSQNKMNFFLN